MQDPSSPFVPDVDAFQPGAASGPLAGMTFAAKDLFDVRGTVTGCGNPDWARTHPPAERSAWTVERLLAAGATLVGKTITDEISLGLLGINRFYGTPLNPAAPDRVPGGSSSGSASAVAAGLVHTALGTDSGGSVRTPASFTGLYGLRPTHGRIPVEGMAVQSPSFDTAGFFARDAATFARVGEVLLDAPVGPGLPDGMLIASDCFAIADPAARDAVRARLDALLDGRYVLCLPTVPILPIRRDARLSEMREAVTRIIHLTCIAGLTGLPQISLPLVRHDGIPVGLSLIGWRGSDTVLLALAKAIGPTALPESEGNAVR